MIDITAQRLSFKQFYEENGASLFGAIHCDEFGCPVLSSNQIALVSIGELQPFEAWVVQSSRNIPRHVQDAFSRHLWYSQWTLAHIQLEKVEVDVESFFLLMHSGVSDDGWDNDAFSVDIFNERGDFVYATNYIDRDKGEGREWKTKQTDHGDFTYCAGGIVPPWPGDEPDIIYSDTPIWTVDTTTPAAVKTVTNVEVRDNEDGTTTTISHIRESS